MKLLDTILSQIEPEIKKIYSTIPASSIETGINALPKDSPENQNFVSLWGKFNGLLNSILKQVIYNTTHDFLLHNRVPTQKQMLQLQHLCLQLTELWYGKNKGNISRILVLLRDIMDHAKLTAYNFTKVLKKMNDFNQYEVNLQYRMQAYPSLDKLYTEYKAVGGSIFTGRSQIDNLLPNNIFLTKDYKKILLLINLQKAIIKFLKKIRQYQNKALQDFGQLPHETQIKLFNLVTNNKNKTNKEDLEPIFYELVELSKNKPGTYISKIETHTSARETYLSALCIGIWQEKLTIIKRSNLENLTPMRYLTYAWQRKIPFESRKEGTVEYSRFHTNKLCYGPNHFLGMTGSCYREGLEAHGTPAYDLNFIVDNEAHLPNNTCDFEKIAKEVKIISAKSNILPEETRFTMWQSTRFISSIPQTQHTHMLSADINNFALYKKQNNQIMVSKIEGTYDIINAGTKKEAFFFKFIVKDPANYYLLTSLNAIKNAVCKEYGEHAVDFHFQIVQDLEDNFIIALHVFGGVRVEKNTSGQTYLYNAENHALEHNFVLLPYCLAGGVDIEREKLFDFLSAPPGTRAFAENVLITTLNINSLDKKNNISMP